MKDIFSMRWHDKKLDLLDQTLLPNKITYETLTTSDEVFEAIQTMKVRGAPAIGVAAGYGMVLAAFCAPDDNFWEFFKDNAEKLKKSRPTAVNLSWAINRMENLALSLKGETLGKIRSALEVEAIAIQNEDTEINKKIGENLLSLIKDGDGVLTHCNAGELATSAYGTALSPFYLAKEKGMNIKVYADETRPRLQGARLTSFELFYNGIDVTLICDNMAPLVMRDGKVSAVIVGCDRIAANGDTANKVGTFGVSIAAKYFGIPFYIAAPTPTIDMNCATGKNIPIEERSNEEILCINGEYIAPKGVKTYNPAFDVTPAENIAAIVTEKGIVRAPFPENLKKLME
ncbi:MAG: S-methyl-5-thioribose-1-phosphate isomerase [Hydrogenoanaerobacterium sp.]